MSTSEVKDNNATKQGSPPPLDEPFKNKETAKSPTTTTGQDAQGANAKSTKDSTMVTDLEHLGESPAYIDCPYCEKRTLTRVEQNDSSQTTHVNPFLCLLRLMYVLRPAYHSYRLAAALCCLCCGVITVCIPFLCHWCADIDHRCSECGKQVSHKPHDGPVQARYPTGSKERPSKYAAMPAAQREQLVLPLVEQQPERIEPIVAAPPEKAHVP
ncbi:hypothetical protein EJ04DRAFT_509645 [Polyplosphaeria fusca]|uniref:LITAF domain-containing protein n=1 Tax=Polyplosphaeria fusca TaxID=682080 RepID=A0A9P4R856_9PLEO|nr:hypothetical protein EJ04DRAFT_509645 [Polyplosphaeria fusca]